MQIKRLTALIALGTLAGAAHATDGYFADGYGMKAQGMGGASAAMADDAFGGANNPASMAFVGDRLDVGIEVFSPRRSASRSGSMATLTQAWTATAIISLSRNSATTRC